jgi:hypothetical protein
MFHIVARFHPIIKDLLTDMATPVEMCIRRFSFFYVLSS